MSMPRISVRLTHGLPLTILIVVLCVAFAIPFRAKTAMNPLTQGALVAGCLCWLVVGLSLRARAWRILDTPTTKTVAAAVGSCEFSGLAVSDAPTVSPGTRTLCVWYDWQLQELVSSGKNSTWKTRDHRRHEQPFFVEDDTGRLRVDPRGAQFDGLRAHTMEVPGRSKRKWRQVELLLPMHGSVYALGPVRVCPSSNPVVLELASNGEDEFFISDDAEHKVARRYQVWAWVSLVLGLLAIAAMPYAKLKQESDFGRRSVWFEGHGSGKLAVLLAALYVVALAASWLVRVYNRLLIVKNQAERAWSSIQVQLQRRMDLIPSLVSVVQAYAAYEVSTLTGLVRSRGSLPDDAELARAEANDASATAEVRQLLARVEASPDLKANENYLALQREITDTENRIAYSRAFYNDAINIMRDRHQSFPYVLVAGFVKVPSLELFEATDRHAVTVQTA
jgi:LemA protein